jgi:hypothetical protein
VAFSCEENRDFQGGNQWLVLVKGIMNVFQGGDKWLVLVKGILNVVQDKNQCRVPLKKQRISSV